MLGLCLWKVENGDTVVQLSGASVPYLLLPLPDSEEEFRSIGECSVLGIMHCDFMCQQNEECIKQRISLLS
jgi:hypothetical protein